VDVAALPIPAPPASFVGRGELLDAATTRFGTNSGRPLMITGIGGVGKTAFAVALADRLRGQFPDGVLFVDLCGMSTPLPAVEALRRLVGALRGRPALTGDLDELLPRFRALVGGRALLLVPVSPEQVDVTAVHQAGVLPFSRTWPLLIIVLGVMKLIERWHAPRAPFPPPPPPAGGPRP